MSLLDLPVAKSKRGKRVRVMTGSEIKARKRAPREAYANRYSDAVVARAKAVFLISDLLTTEWIAQEAGLPHHSSKLYRAGHVKAHVKPDQAVYDAIFLAIRQALKGFINDPAPFR